MVRMYSCCSYSSETGVSPHRKWIADSTVHTVRTLNVPRGPHINWPASSVWREVTGAHHPPEVEYITTLQQSSGSPGITPDDVLGFSRSTSLRFIVLCTAGVIDHQARHLKHRLHPNILHPESLKSPSYGVEVFHCRSLTQSTDSTHIGSTSWHFSLLLLE